VCDRVLPCPLLLILFSLPYCFTHLAVLLLLVVSLLYFKISCPNCGAFLITFFFSCCLLLQVQIWTYMHRTHDLFSSLFLPSFSVIIWCIIYYFLIIPFINSTWDSSLLFDACYSFPLLLLYEKRDRHFKLFFLLFILYFTISFFHDVLEGLH